MFARCLVLILTFGPALAFAAPAYYESRPDRGAKVISFHSPNLFTEECVIQKPFPGLKLSPADLKHQEKLCSLNFYDTRQSYAVCPKIASSNPGLEILAFKPEIARSPLEYQQKYCALAKDKPGEMVAKFKQSITCAYTPSPLAYFQIAKVLGGILHVPPVVIRTMDKIEHRKLVELGVDLARRAYGSHYTLIRKGWESDWISAHDNPEGDPRKPFPTAVEAPWLFTIDFKGIYGYLIITPRIYQEYKEVSGSYSYETRYDTFKAQPPFQRVTRPEPLAQFVSRDFKEAAPIVTQMKDVSDMVVLDTLLNQQDRVGNIAFTPYVYFLKAGHVQTELAQVDSKGSLTEEQQRRIEKSGGQQSTLVKEMMLFDNDCGVSKANMARFNNLLEGVHHMNLETYRRLLWLAQAIERPEVERYFKTELLFNSEDWDGQMKLKANVQFAARHLRQKCQRGALWLDLDLEAHLNGQTPQSFERFCELPAGYKI